MKRYALEPRSAQGSLETFYHHGDGWYERGSNWRDGNFTVSKGTNDSDTEFEAGAD